MSKRSVEELAKIGLSALGGDPTEAEARLVRAIAAMVSAAPTRTKKASVDNLPVSPRDFFKCIESTDKVICAPVDARWFGRLGGVLRSIHVEPDDLFLLQDWLVAGGVATWPTGKPGFSNLIAQLDKWLGYSREWNSRGRPQLGVRGAGSVGRELPDVDWGDFRRGG